MYPTRLIAGIADDGLGFRLKTIRPKSSGGEIVLAENDCACSTAPASLMSKMLPVPEIVPAPSMLITPPIANGAGVVLPSSPLTKNAYPAEGGLCRLLIDS